MVRCTLILLVASASCGRLRFGLLVDGAIDDAIVDAPGPTSCIGLPATCGLMGDGPCCDSPVVPGGTYSRDYDVSGDGMYPDPSFVAMLGDFRLDKYEVTVGRFRRYVVAGQGTQANPPLSSAGAHPNIAGSGWDATWNSSLPLDTTALIAALDCNATYQTWTDTPGPNESRPINCLTWYDAMAFCAWDAGFMPTDAEWNYAAAGGSEQRAYPWSAPPAFLGIDPTRASYWDGVDCVGDGIAGCALTDQLVVGSKPAGDGRWGQSDLSGNVWEWTLDWYAPYTTPCNDCANLTPSPMGRANRSGNFERSPASVRSSYRDVGSPDYRAYLNGVRCARSL